MKLSKEELKNKINDTVSDTDVAISLLEDIEDSFVEGEVDDGKIKELEGKLEEAEAKVEELKQKYKERFLKGNDEVIEEKEDTDEEVEEKEVVDIKEI